MLSDEKMGGPYFRAAFLFPCFLLCFDAFTSFFTAVPFFIGFTTFFFLRSLSSSDSSLSSPLKSSSELSELSEPPVGVCSTAASPESNPYSSDESSESESSIFSCALDVKAASSVWPTVSSMYSLNLMDADATRWKSDLRMTGGDWSSSPLLSLACFARNSASATAVWTALRICRPFHCSTS